jgi:hypothetical protein
MQPAIFAKNHLAHLTEAVEIATANPDQLVTFQSRAAWSGGAKLLARHGTDAVPIFFAVTDGEPVVRYRARLKEIILRPDEARQRVQELLALRPRFTQTETLWSAGKGTLFAIAGCFELPKPIPFALLIKDSDGLPISDDYGYSYSILRLTLPDQQTATTEARTATDVTPPPPRTESVIRRIIRDTAMVRKLKLLYDHKCQLCGTRLAQPDGKGYSEGHHLRPLGRPHDGPDLPSNVLILCPNCHALCDLGVTPLSRTAVNVQQGHDIAEEYLEYHNGLVSERDT